MRGDAHIHAELGADQQQRVTHVVARVAQVGVADLLQRLVAVFAHGHDVGDHLRRVILVGQTVEYRYAAIAREFLDDFLLEAAVLDRVVHAPEYPGGVLHALLMADLRGVGIDIGDVRALVVGGHLKGAAGARRGLLEDQCDVLALEVLALGTGVLGALEVTGQIEQVAQLALAVMHQAEQAAVVRIERHDSLPLFARRRESTPPRAVSSRWRRG
jgi:hypothetical protein